MPTPQELQTAWDSPLGAKASALNLGVSYAFLREAWVTLYGEPAYKERGKHIQALSAAENARKMSEGRVFKDVTVVCASCGKGFLSRRTRPLRWMCRTISAKPANLEIRALSAPNLLRAREGWLPTFCIILTTTPTTGYGKTTKSGRGPPIRRSGRTTVTGTRSLGTGSGTTATFRKSAWS